MNDNDWEQYHSLDAFLRHSKERAEAYAAGFKAGLERAARMIVENEERRTTSTYKAFLGPRDTGNISGMGFAEAIWEELKKI